MVIAINLGMYVCMFLGARFARLWAGVTTNDTNLVPLAVLLKPNSVLPNSYAFILMLCTFIIKFYILFYY